jgi:hypothetical protein
MAARLGEFAKKVLLSVTATAVSLALAEAGLRMSGWYFAQREAPVWLRALIDPPLPGMPARRDPISGVVLPPLATAVDPPPERPDVTIPPGKPPPPDRSAWKPPPFYRFDPTTGATLNPGVEGWWMAEGTAWVAINHEGFRDRDHAVASEPNVFRIVVLGDSFAEALQVPQRDTFWSVLEQRLQACPSLAGRRVEVLSFGVSGYGTTQELLVYRKFARKYRPDLVLLAFFIGNDLRDNLRSLSEAAGPTYLTRPFYAVSGDELVLDDSFLRPSQASQTSWHGPLWVEQLRIVQIVRVVMGWFGSRFQRTVDARALISPPDPECEQAWEVTEKVLARLDAEVKADGGRLVVATISAPEQVDPDPDRRAGIARAGSIQDLFYPDKRLFRLAGDAGFQMIPLAPAMAEVAERTRTYFHGFANTVLGVGHWNYRGHSVAGQILANEICRTTPLDTTERR